jgi:WD40 repeat protein
VAVSRFKNHLIALLTDDSYERVDIVAHSFGAYIAIEALAHRELPSTLKLHTVILAGSVLSPDYNLSQVIGQHRVITRLINDCGLYDRVLLLTFFVFGVGMGGRLGMHGFETSRFVNRYFAFGHSGYFAPSTTWEVPDQLNAFMVRWWLPLLRSDSEEIARFSERRLHVPVNERVWRILGENGGSVTAIFYMTLFTAIIVPLLYFWQISVHEKKLAASEWLANQADLFRETHPQRSILLAIQAGKQYRSPTTFAALQEAVAQSGGREFTGLGELHHACLHRSAALLLNEQGELYLLSSQQEASPPTLLKKYQDHPVYFQCSFDGRFALFGVQGDASRLFVWDVAAGIDAEEKRIQLAEEIAEIKASPGSDIVAIKSVDGTLGVVDLTFADRRAAELVPIGPAGLFEFNNAGTGLITSSGKASSVWKLKDGAAFTLVGTVKSPNDVAGVALSSNFVGVLYESDGKLGFWNALSGTSVKAYTLRNEPDPTAGASLEFVALRGFVKDSDVLLLGVFVDGDPQRLLAIERNETVREVVIWDGVLPRGSVHIAPLNQRIIVLQGSTGQSLQDIDVMDAYNRKWYATSFGTLPSHRDYWEFRYLEGLHGLPGVGDTDVVFSVGSDTVLVKTGTNNIFYLRHDKDWSAWQKAIGHEAIVTRIWSDAEGRGVLSSDHKGNLRYWNSASVGEGVYLVPPSPDGRHLNRLSVSSDGSYLAASRRNEVLIWKSSEGFGKDDPIAIALPGEAFAVDFDPSQDHLLAVSDVLSNVGVVDLTESPLRPSFLSPLPKGGVFSLAHSPDGRLLAAGTTFGTVYLWSLKPDPQFLRVLGEREDEDWGPVFGLAFSPDGKRLVASAAERYLRVWDLERGGVQVHIPNFTEDERFADIYDIEFSADGRFVAAAGVNRVYIWEAGDLEDGPHELVGHENNVWGIEFDADDGRLASGGDYRVMLWDVDRLEERPVIWRDHELPVHDVAFGPDGESLISVGLDGLLIVRILSWEELIERGCRTANRELTADEVRDFGLSTMSLPTCGNETKDGPFRPGAGTASSMDGMVTLVASEA